MGPLPASVTFSEVVLHPDPNDYHGQINMEDSCEQNTKWGPLSYLTDS